MSEKGENTGRRLLVSGAARTISLVVRMAVGFFMLPFMVGHLGDYWYGVFTATLGLVANFHLMDLGFANATMRQTAICMATGDDDGVNQTINTAFRIYLLLGCCVFVLTLGFVAFAPMVVEANGPIGVVRLILFIIGLDLAITFPLKCVAGIVLAKVRYDLLMIVDLFTVAVGVAANVWFLKAGYGVIALTLIAFGTGQLSNLLYLGLAKYLFRPLRFSWHGFDRQRGRELASYSVWSFLIQMANQLRFRIDSLTVGGLFGGEAITRYVIGSRLAEYAQTPLTQVSSITMPVLTKMHAAQQGERAADTVLLLLRFNLLMAVYAGGLVMILGRPFISRWMGPTHSDSHIIASILALGFLTEVFLLPLTNWLFAAARHRMLAVANVTEAIANVVLSILLGRMFGLEGVAWGTVVPLVVVQLFWVAPYACRSVGLSLRRLSSLVAPAAISMAIVTVAWFFLGDTVDRGGYAGVVWGAAAVTLLYWPTTFFLCLRREDRGYIWRALPLPVAAHGLLR